MRGSTPRGGTKYIMYPLLIKNFITQQEIDTVLNWTKSIESLFGKLVPGNFWAGRSLDYSLMPKNIQDILYNSFYRGILLLNEKPNLIPEILHITRWPPDPRYELMPHADAEEPNGRKHIYWWRQYGAIIYLNNDFEGGELYYPNLHIVVKPEPGLLAIHPGTLKYLHGVKPVIGNTRYTLTSFFKYDNSTP